MDMFVCVCVCVWDFLTNVNISDGVNVCKVRKGDNRKQTGWNWRQAHSWSASWRAIRVTWKKLQQLTGMKRCFQALNAAGVFLLFCLEFGVYILLFMCRVTFMTIWDLRIIKTLWASRKNHTKEQIRECRNDLRGQRRSVSISRLSK